MRYQSLSSERDEADHTECASPLDGAQIHRIHEMVIALPTKTGVYVPPDLSRNVEQPIDLRESRGTNKPGRVGLRSCSVTHNVRTTSSVLAEGKLWSSDPMAPLFPKGKEHTIMSNHVTFINRIVRWILPLLAVLLIAMYLVLSPAMFTHAAAPTHHNIVVPHQSAPEANPEMYWPY